MTYLCAKGTGTQFESLCDDDFISECFGEYYL